MTHYVVDGRFLAARPTGLHRVARSLLSAAIDAGLSATVWAPGGVADPLVQRRVRLPTGRIAGRVWEQAILPVVAGRDPVLSLTNTCPVVRPGVVMVHDLAPRVGPQWFAGSMRSYAATVVAGARRARLVVTVSQAVRDELVEAGVAPAAVVVVPPAVDERFRPADDESMADVRRRFGLDRAYAVMLGWADPRKDLPTALGAHRTVVAQVPHDLVLVGEPHPTFAPVAVPHGDSVRVLGSVSDADLVPLLSAAAVLLYPSRYEGFGLPPLEAAACGTPAVAGDIPAVRESSGDVTRLEPVGDVDAWADALLDALSGRLSCRYVPERSWPQAGRQLVAALTATAER